MPAPSRKARKRARIKATKTRWLGSKPMTSIKDLRERAQGIINGIIKISLTRDYRDINVSLLETPFGYSLTHPDMLTQTRKWLVNQLRKASREINRHFLDNEKSCKYPISIIILFNDNDESPILRISCEGCDTKIHAAIMTNVDPNWSTELAKMKADIPADITDLDLDIWKKKPKSEADLQDTSPRGPISGSLDTIRELLRGGNL